HVGAERSRWCRVAHAGTGCSITLPLFFRGDVHLAARKMLQGAGVSCCDVTHGARLHVHPQTHSLVRDKGREKRKHLNSSTVTRGRKVTSLWLGWDNAREGS
ncbi:unnamed protein product, partial [Scytosiphon promiscuus]